MTRSPFPPEYLMPIVSSERRAWLEHPAVVSFHTRVFVPCVYARFVSIVNSYPLLTKLPHVAQVPATILNNILGLTKVCVPGSLSVLKYMLKIYASSADETGVVKKHSTGRNHH